MTDMITFLCKVHSLLPNESLFILTYNCSAPWLRKDEKLALEDALADIYW